MNWDRTNQIIRGMYMDEYPIQGRVLNSRVAYGGRIKHMVKLLRPITIFGTERDCLTISEQQVL